MWDCKGELGVNEVVEYLEKDYDDLFLTKPIEGAYEDEPPRYFSYRHAQELFDAAPGPHCRREMFETIDDSDNNCYKYSDMGPCSCGKMPSQVFSQEITQEELNQWIAWGVVPLYSHHTRDLMDRNQSWYHAAWAAEKSKAKR
jgi:hypothetical protein